MNINPSMMNEQKWQKGSHKEISQVTKHIIQTYEERLKINFITKILQITKKIKISFIQSKKKKGYDCHL